MSGQFRLSREIPQEYHRDRVKIRWISRPSETGAAVTVIDATLEPGAIHNFHIHPNQDEVLLINDGHIEQWLEDRMSELGPGDAVYVPMGTVHATFNTGRKPCHLTAILAPTAQPDGYEEIDVSNQEPWASVRGRVSVRNGINS